ncbi:hypothetical protein C8N36_110132 [Pelagimonas varians]|uniref:Uncharacterized protein n=1 Tax=Pelagimonas varians TaxID=696760 RepID=A0A238KNF0_9RHOB|nr:hypothetical protein C8N36_110132 [Pelagimonas varians]SMX44150.1 hypothetical protein PEV8663_02801 [Pelagimonas varians]
MLGQSNSKAGQNHLNILVQGVSTEPPGYRSQTDRRLWKWQAPQAGCLAIRLKRGLKSQV